MNNRILTLFATLLFITMPHIHGGVTKETIITSPGCGVPVHLMFKGKKVWSWSEQGICKSLISSHVRQYTEDCYYRLVIEGKDPLGKMKTVELCGSYDQRIFCPNLPPHKAWRQLCEIDPKKDFVCINFKDPVPIKEYHFIPLYWNKVRKKTIEMWTFEVKDHGIFFATELHIPLHNSPALVVPLTTHLLNLATQCLITYALACAGEYAGTKLYEFGKSAINSSPPNSCISTPQKPDKPAGCFKPEPPPQQEGCNKPNSITPEITQPLTHPIQTPIPTDAITCPGIKLEEQGALVLFDKITPEELIAEATAEQSKPHATSIYVKPSVDDLGKDFDRLNPSNIRTQVNPKGDLVTIGTIEDGRTVIKRVASRDSRPTLEIQEPQKSYTVIKIRYGEETKQP